MRWLSNLFILYRKYVVFGVTVILSLSLISLDRQDEVEFAKAVSEAIFAGAQKSLWWTIRLRDLGQDNKRLRAENARLALENSILKEAELENKRLRKLLGFKKRSGFKLTPAKVIGVDADRIVNSILIDMGRNTGIEVNMPVVTAEGLVGKIIDVFPKTALVQLLLDRNCRVSAIVQRSRTLGIVEWERGNVCKLKNVPVRSDVQVGDVVVSSGMGGVFPKGIEIGQVSELDQEKGRLFKKIKVIPSVDFAHLEEVFVLTVKNSRRLMPER